MTIELLNCDCMTYMATLPDKAFDLAIVDPPYGGGCNAAIGGHFSKYENIVGGGSNAEKYENKVEHWDIAPDQSYFNELARVSKNQIIWGGNYFDLPPTRCFVVWRKLTISEKFTMAMCEYGWTSFNENAKWIAIAPQEAGRFHPTQKPIKLYEWLLTNYAKQGDRILDTHLGSGSSAIAAHNLGFGFVGTELDKDYYDAAVKRFNAHIAQARMFGDVYEEVDKNEFEQQDLL